MLQSSNFIPVPLSPNPANGLGSTVQD